MPVQRTSIDSLDTSTPISPSNRVCLDAGNKSGNNGDNGVAGKASGVSNACDRVKGSESVVHAAENGDRDLSVFGKEVLLSKEPSDDFVTVDGGLTALRAYEDNIEEKRVSHTNQSTPSRLTGRGHSLNRSTLQFRTPSHKNRSLDPMTPHVLLLYLQLAFNAVLVLVVAYIGYLIVSTLRADIRQKIDMCISDALNEISLCSKEYYRNKCYNDEQNKRPPALDQTCAMWEQCMNRDPQQLAKSFVTAETLADVLNAFVHRLSWKSLVFLLCLITCCILASQRQLSGMCNERIIAHYYDLQSNIAGPHGLAKYEETIECIADQSHADESSSCH